MTKSDIIKRLYGLDDEGFVLHSALLYKRDKELCFAAVERYGSVRKAVEAAGLKYPEVDDEKLELALAEMERKLVEQP